MYYRILYIIAFKSTCDIKVHCMDGEVGQSEGQLKSCTKKHLEFEKNAVDHTTFTIWLTGQPLP